MPSSQEITRKYLPFTEDYKRYITAKGLLRKLTFSQGTHLPNSVMGLEGYSFYNNTWVIGLYTCTLVTVACRCEPTIRLGIIVYNTSI